MNTAQRLVNLYVETKNYERLVRNLAQEEAEVDQDWDHEATVYTFKDGSKLMWNNGDLFTI